MRGKELNITITSKTNDQKGLVTSWTRTSTSGSKRHTQRTTFHSDHDKNKEEKELGVGVCLLTKRSWLSLLLFDNTIDYS